MAFIYLTKFLLCENLILTKATKLGDLSASVGSQNQGSRRCRSVAHVASFSSC